jgi:hypothetical protein
MIPALVTAAGERTSMRFLEFFAANIRNRRTRQAYTWLSHRAALDQMLRGTPVAVDLVS